MLWEEYVWTSFGEVSVTDGFTVRGLFLEVFYDLYVKEYKLYRIRVTVDTGRFLLKI